MVSIDIKIISGLIVLAVIVGGIAFFGIQHINPNKSAISSTIVQQSGSSTNQTSTNSSKTLFSSMSYAQYAYLVYPGPVSAQAQAALSGFNLNSSVLQNGSTAVKITVIGSSQSQTLILKPNYKLYIIETSFGDDTSRFDASLGDDGFVVVDQNGYIA